MLCAFLSLSILFSVCHDVNKLLGHTPTHTHHASLCCHRPRPVTMQYNQVTTRLLSPCHHVLKPSSFPCRLILSTVCDSNGHLSTTVCNVKCTLSLKEATLVSSFVLKTKCSDCHSVWKWSPNFSCPNGDSRTCEAIQSMIQDPPFEKPLIPKLRQQIFFNPKMGQTSGTK